MKINILTYSDECLEFLSFFPMTEMHSIQIESVNTFEGDKLIEFTENSLGWESWLRFRSFSNLKDWKYSKEDLAEVVLKTNFHHVGTFIKKHKILTFEKLQSLFFFKENEEYVTEAFSESLKRQEKSGINGNSYGVSLNFTYSQCIEDGELFTNDILVQNAYDQLRAFYSLFSQKYSSSLLYLIPHFDPKAREEIDAIHYGDFENYSSNDDYEDGWAELGREEESRMNIETDGDWRWNID